MKKVFKWGWYLLLIALIFGGIAWLNHGVASVSIKKGRPQIMWKQGETLKKDFAVGDFDKLNITAGSNIEIKTGDHAAVQYLGDTREQPTVTFDQQRKQVTIVQDVAGKHESHDFVGAMFTKGADPKIIVIVPRETKLNNLALHFNGQPEENRLYGNNRVEFKNITAERVKLTGHDLDNLFCENVNFSQGKISFPKAFISIKNSTLTQMVITDNNDVNEDDIKIEKTILNGGSLQGYHDEIQFNHNVIHNGYQIINEDGLIHIHQVNVAGVKITSKDDAVKRIGSEMNHQDGTMNKGDISKNVLDINIVGPDGVARVESMKEDLR
ncbi:DUF4097 family beta strand repeat-containing protein [Ligilactobacillus ceti]|uniref:DUF4097 domain-containing protein n=1 Tax=Ligilactobacillus ceti DSM 22408 TaxID=1122146 RepID=A0A0R2KPK8_9LACO|nr:DUF4097 family beta strand repeat-containing protein [Ligilactobacillus ceti]KRN89638.1 hypothetical protein IV53_GL001188 [Ligilactobacillus ceti DSM 22408]